MPRIEEKLFEICFGDEEFNTAMTPMSQSFNEEYANQEEPLNAKEVTRQRRLLGLILQLVPIRSDLSFPHSLLSTRVLRATQRDYEALKRIVRYIAFTTPLGLTLHPSTTSTGISTPLPLALYFDYSHNAHPDSKGHYGVAATLGDKSGPFYVKGEKLQVVTDSTTSGEIAAGVKICKTNDWLKSVADTLELTLRQPTPLHLDNKSMIAVCTKITGATKRLRHILLHIHFVLERVQQGQIELVHLPTHHMIVDMLTKALAPMLHWQHMPHLLGSSDAMTEKLAQVQRILAGSEKQPMYRRRGAPEIEHTVTTPLILKDSASASVPPTDSQSVSTTTTTASVSSVAATTTTPESLLAAAAAAAVQAATTVAVQAATAATVQATVSAMSTTTSKKRSQRQRTRDKLRKQHDLSESYPPPLPPPPVLQIPF